MPFIPAGVPYARLQVVNFEWTDDSNFLVVLWDKHLRTFYRVDKHGVESWNVPPPRKRKAKEVPPEQTALPGVE